MLARIIRERRMERGWSLSQLAARSQVSRQMLSFIETHRRVATTDTLQRIAHALGIGGSTLLQFAEQRAADWPVQCHACNYSCVEHGGLKWWNPRRGCVRPRH